jgi:hypothetical protein
MLHLNSSKTTEKHISEEDDSEQASWAAETFAKVAPRTRNKDSSLKSGRLSSGKKSERSSPNESSAKAPPRKNNMEYISGLFLIILEYSFRVFLIT